MYVQTSCFTTCTFTSVFCTFSFQRQTVGSGPSGDSQQPPGGDTAGTDRRTAGDTSDHSQQFSFDQARIAAEFGGGNVSEHITQELDFKKLYAAQPE